MVSKTTNNTAFTLIELLIGVIIIGILVAIIVPVYVNRANEARYTAAQSDLDGLKTGQEHAAIDTGYFYRLYVLDDTRGGDGIAPDAVNAGVPADITDGIRDEHLRADAGTNPENIFISTVTGEVLLNGQAIYGRLANETLFNWNGPYINIVRKYKAGEGPPRVPAGLPLDPWGNPYLFFTKAGLVEEPRGEIVETVTIAGSTHNTKIFDRPTILTLGPDGIPGNGGTTTFAQGDDMYRQF
jgi:prepilin-type N-terminal cleavage/methylation domain-containing protein